MKVLITGGAGFIGTHTTRELVAQGHSVRVLDILDPQIHGPNAAFPKMSGSVEYMRGDVRDRNDVERALEGVDAVFHLASLTGVGQSMYEIKNYVDVNVTGTANLIDVIISKKIPIKKFILSSSRAVYGEGTHACPKCDLVYPRPREKKDLDRGLFRPMCPACRLEVRPLRTSEDRPLVPTSIYGWTKREQEELCLYAARTFKLPVTVLRYFNVYGEGQSLKNPYTGIVSIFYNRIKNGQSVSLYEHGLPERDFVHVKDVVSANLLALNSPSPADGLPINIGSGQITTIRAMVEVIESILSVTGKSVDSGEFRVGDIFSCVADLTRAQTLLGYKPAVSLKSGLEKFYAWADRLPSTEKADLYDQTVRELKLNGLFGAAA